MDLSTFCVHVHFVISWLKNISFSTLFSRAFNYCVTCHAAVKNPELIKECECSRGIEYLIKYGFNKYLIALHKFASKLLNTLYLECNYS